MRNILLKSFFYTFILMLLSSCKKETEIVQKSTFTNPLLQSGADPFSVYVDGFYYYTHTTGNRIDLWKTKSLADLKSAKKITIWTPPQGTEYSRDIWAPEIHFLGGKWYAYFAADNGNNNTHKMYVLENEAKDPFTGEWVFKGKVAAETDTWAIDGNVINYKNQLYMIWSGWEGNTNGQQNIYIAKMKNPLEIDGDRVLLSSPTNNWETHGFLGDDSNPSQVNVNEGPQFLIHNEDVFIVFSASGCWTDYYSLGLLTFNGTTNLLDASAWEKSNSPIFQQSITNKVFAPGHNSFFKSPDGKEDWILYHANSEPGEGCGNLRSPRMQKIHWNSDGKPNLGIPISEKTALEIPSE